MFHCSSAGLYHYCREKFTYHTHVFSRVRAPLGAITTDGKNGGLHVDTVRVAHCHTDENRLSRVAT